MTRAPSDAGMDHIPEAGKMVERVARALVISRGAAIIASDEHWTKHVSFYHEMCAKYPHYADDNSLVNDAFRDARAAIDAMRYAATKEMETAALQFVRPYHDIQDLDWRMRMPKDLFRLAWKAMIDAALRDGEG